MLSAVGSLVSESQKPCCRAEGFLTLAAVAKYPCKHTEGVLWMAAWLVARGNKKISGEIK